MPFDETRFAVFSAHAEVVPTRPPAHDPARRILRARGGSSKSWMWRNSRSQYSPRTRR